MGYPAAIGLRYLRSQKRQFISVITAVAVISVALAVGVLTTEVAVMTGFEEAFRDKVLGVNAHVLILKYGLDFTEYRDVMRRARGIRGVVGVAPFVINEMMLVSERRHKQSGVLLKGVDPNLVGEVLDVRRHLRSGSLEGLRIPGARPPIAPRDMRGEGERAL